MFRQRFSEITKNDVDLTTKFLGFPVLFPIVAPTNPDLKYFMLHREIAKLGGFGVIHLEEASNLHMYAVNGANMPIMVVDTDINSLKAIKAAYDAGIRIFLIEQLAPNMAAIHQMNAIKAKHPEAKVILGNFQDDLAVREMLKYGKPDAIKIGLSSGCNDPVSMLGFDSNLYESIKSVKTFDIPIIAEGDILEAKDVLEAIHAGADLVIMEELCAGAEESDKEIKMSVVGAAIQYQHKFFKTHYNTVPSLGPIKMRIETLQDEMRQIMSLMGCKDYKSFRESEICK